MQPGNEKSVTQKLSDATDTKPGEESYLDTAKKTIGDAVEYVEKTAEGWFCTVHLELSIADVVLCHRRL